MLSDRILAGADAVLVRIGGFLFGRKEDGLVLEIGDIREVLEAGRIYRLRGNGRGDYSIDSSVELGWKRKRGRVLLQCEREPNPHIVIVGMSGFGKSTLLASMIKGIGAHGTPVVLFDAHNEHEGVIRSIGGTVHDASSAGMNIMELDGLTVAQRVSELVGLLREVYALGHIQCTKLGDCLRYTYRKAGFRSASDTAGTRIPTLADLMEEIGVFISNSKSAVERNTLLHLKGKLQPLLAIARCAPINIPSLCSGVSSLSLAGLRGQEMRAVYIHELVRRLYRRMHDNPMNGGVRMYLAVDEAEFMLGEGRKGGTAIGRIIEEGRKYGVGVIMAAHMLSDMDRRIVANASTLISFYAREPGDVNYISNAMAGGIPERAAAVRQRLQRLRRGEALLQSGLHKAPAVIGIRWQYARDAGGTTERAPSEIAASAKRAVRFEALTGTLGFEPTGEQLSRAGVETGTFACNGNPERWAMARNRSLSLEHEVRVAQISRMLSQRGTKSYVVDNASGPDIVALDNGARIAVEYETGNKAIGDTAAMVRHRLEDYARCVVLVKRADEGRYRDALRLAGVEVACVEDFLGA